MNLRLACDVCGAQPCECHEADCRACNGEGERYVTAPGLPRAPLPVPCEECRGEGWIKCDGPRAGGECPFDHCYCEATYDRQQEADASEPPLSAAERHQLAWKQKQELRR
jgi:DnaJ-class molecular chaperone